MGSCSVIRVGERKMVELNEWMLKIENPELRAQIQLTADRLVKQQKKFGLVFEANLSMI